MTTVEATRVAPTTTAASPAPLPSLTAGYTAGEAHAAVDAAHGQGAAGAALHGAVKGHEGDDHANNPAVDAKEILHAAEHGTAQTSRAVKAGAQAARGLFADEIAGEVAHDPHSLHHSPLHKGIGALGAAGGAVQVVAGVQELAHGDTANGVKDVASGSAYTAAGVLEVAGAATKLAGGLAGVGAVIEGGKSLWDGYKETDLGKTVSGGTMAVGGGLLLGAATGLIAAPAAAVAGGVLVAGSVLYTAYRHFSH